MFLFMANFFYTIFIVVCLNKSITLSASFFFFSCFYSSLISQNYLEFIYQVPLLNFTFSYMQTLYLLLIFPLQTAKKRLYISLVINSVQI